MAKYSFWTRKIDSGPVWYVGHTLQCFFFAHKDLFGFFLWKTTQCEEYKLRQLEVGLQKGQWRPSGCCLEQHWPCLKACQSKCSFFCKLLQIESHSSEMFTDSAKKTAKRTYQNHVEAAFFCGKCFPIIK